MAVAYKERQTEGRHSRKRRRGGFFRILLLLVILAVAAGGAYKLTDGFRDLHLPVRVDKSNIQTGFNVDYQYLAANLEDRGYSASPEDIAALREVAEKYPEHAEGIEFLLDHMGAYDTTAVRTVLLSPEKTDFALLSPLWRQLEGGSAGSVSVTKGETPFFLQYDSRWAFHGYGSSCMGNTACGPTCLSMAACGLTGDGSLTPDYVSDYAEANGYYVEGAGTAWNLFTDGAAGLGLRGEALSGGREPIIEALKNGGVVVASMLPGDFTMSGHFIVLRGWGLGGFKVYDPSSVERSGETWSWSALGGQIAQCWAIYE